MSQATPISETSPTAALSSLRPRRSRQRGARVVLLILIDLAALLLCCTAAYLLWARPVHQQDPLLYLQLAPLLLLFLFGYAQAGLYPGFGLGPVEMLRRYTLVTSYGFLILAAFSFALKIPHVYSRFTFFIAFVLSLLVVPLARSGAQGLANRWPWWREPVALIGSTARARQALRDLADAGAIGYRPWVVVDPQADDGGEVDGVPVVPGDEEELQRISDAGVRVAFLLDDNSTGIMEPDRLHHRFRHVVTLRRFRDLPVEGVQIRNLGGILGIEYTNNLLDRRNRALKRTLDLVIGGLSLLATLPVVASAVALVKLASPGPAFFTQRRAGLDGHPVDVPKIRTMHPDAEERLEKHLADDPELRAEWQQHLKLRRDPRLIPGIGPFLRRYSLDELPQLWSVVQGEMSLVGPRPFPDYHLARLAPRFRELRQRVRPGVTGLWQVTVRSEGGVEEQEAADSYYIRNWSLWLDLYILARTLGAVLRGKGAY